MNIRPLFFAVALLFLCPFSLIAQVIEEPTEESFQQEIATLNYPDHSTEITTQPMYLPAHIANEAPLIQQDYPTAHNSSYFYDGLKVVESTTEWTIWNIGGEIVEAIVFQQCGLYALAPYCLYMGAVIFHEYENQEYYGAAGTILHALFDIACMLGTRIGFDVAGILGSTLEKCGLKCVADFFSTIHEQIDSLLHTLGVEHAHGIAVEDSVTAAPLQQEIANELETIAEGTLPVSSTAAPVSKSIPGAGWTNSKCKNLRCTKQH